MKKGNPSRRRRKPDPVLAAAKRSSRLAELVDGCAERERLQRSLAMTLDAPSMQFTVGTLSKQLVVIVATSPVWASRLLMNQSTLRKWAAQSGYPDAEIKVRSIPMVSEPTTSQVARSRPEGDDSDAAIDRVLSRNSR